MITFIALFEQMQTTLGEVCLPLEPEVGRPAGFIMTEALYPELAREVAMAVYQSNSCRTMHDPVRLYPTLDALGHLKRSWSESGKIDVDAMDFLERLGIAATKILDYAESSTADQPKISTVVT